MGLSAVPSVGCRFALGVPKSCEEASFVGSPGSKSARAVGVSEEASRTSSRKRCVLFGGLCRNKEDPLGLSAIAFARTSAMHGARFSEVDVGTIMARTLDVVRRVAVWQTGRSVGFVVVMRSAVKRQGDIFLCDATII